MHTTGRDVEELRVEIWDLIFRSNEPKSISEIAERFEQETDVVAEAVSHEWFILTNDMVSISVTQEET